MSSVLLAQFNDAETLMQAARQAKAARYPVLDAFSPFPLEGMAQVLGSSSTSLRVVMFWGGVAIAGLAYGIEIWSALYNYPINSGGRPLNSWPTFVLVPFAVGIFGAALAGFIAFLWQTGLPRLHHPLFFIEGFERATQDRFMLAFETPADEAERARIFDWLKRASASHVWELDA
jgi:hypothetical protein